ncbi:FMN-linked oxidoreductase [Dothidotthia symphoricarpi CBS 119687]|uniref:Dihydroorotate dehydrogenase (quinone), mitochondrial n=1 Tax=Dothidotthia symphoricarpi CBS 119687 TaxID=1392245 RepID=A0A6A6A274_9PLEO|nr:FMN-linked oxidoreductase [Dothidotthia symphoricarpi CBS 119687]KAF2125007.1 FMN-linked oxidoreductase [Dothidotthia symphoricarpi CBS 119687]
MAPGNEYAAEQLKTQGNQCFKNADYDGAEAYYSQAIQKNSSNPLLFTNRANARLKLEKWEGVIDDCIRSIELLKDNMKAFFYLAQAQLSINHPNEALSSALMAYELCTTSAQQTSNAATISALVLKCKKAKWDIRERERVRRRGDLLSDLESLLETQYKKDMDEVDARIESNAVSRADGHEEKEERKSEFEKKRDDLRTSFAISDPEHQQKREVPDYLVDGITFEIMHDPVVTKNGRSYERATLIEHLKRSPTDPLTRETLTIAELRPNIALKEACLDGFFVGLCCERERPSQQQQLRSCWPSPGQQSALATMNTAVQMRALRVRPSIARCRPSHRPFLHPTRSVTIAAHEAATNVRSAGTRTKNLIYGSVITLGLSLGYLYTTDTRASIHEWLIVPALRQIYPDGEDAHEAGTRMLKVLHSFGLNPRERGNDDGAGDLAVEVFGHRLANPIGTSAGIDKGAEVPTPLLQLGAGLVEVGAVTLLPQEGNPKPRVFRLPSQNALINRYGFNSEGAEVVAMRLRQRVREFAYHAGLGMDEDAERAVLDGEAGVPPGSLISGRLMAVQVAKNKTTSEEDIEAVVRDYTTAVSHVGKYADILVVNVSSPNTPGLRTLQNVEPLTRLLSGVVQAVKKIDRKTKPAIMVKVSPDEDSEEQISGICEAVWDSGVDGVIVGNTTKKRPDPLPKGYKLPNAEARLLLEQGGYSGPQMFERTLALVAKYRRTLDDGPKAVPAPEKPAKTSSPTTKTTFHIDEATPSSNIDDLAESAPTLTVHATPDTAPAPQTPRKVIFATGGITNGRQAREILDAGASVAQVYTALIYSGAGTISRIKKEMREEAAKQGTVTKR